ncbi:hypothetical protein B0H10DRAFT_1951519 [Mycena sp. CBHHK59/15]|nr:hypothetical protein B0H10DRAFT_1951519 [Mycena sp. CBHHK59/15]
MTARILRCTPIVVIKDTVTLADVSALFDGIKFFPSLMTLNHQTQKASPGPPVRNFSDDSSPSSSESDPLPVPQPRRVVRARIQPLTALHTDTEEESAADNRPFRSRVRPTRSTQPPGSQASSQCEGNQTDAWTGSEDGGSPLAHLRNLAELMIYLLERYGDFRRAKYIGYPPKYNGKTVWTLYAAEYPLEFAGNPPRFIGYLPKCGGCPLKYDEKLALVR